MNKDEYIISIVGTQCTDDGEPEVIEITTTGGFTVAPTGNKFIRYKEYDSENPAFFQTTTIKISDNQITITRMGDYSSQLILECGKRHQSCYQTPVGSLMIGVFTNAMDIDLNKSGGKISVEYTLDCDGSTVSENTLNVKLKRN